MEITKCAALLVFAFLFLHKVHCEEEEVELPISDVQPMSMSHHSYFQFGANNGLEPETQFGVDNGLEPETAGRSKRAAAVAFTIPQADEIVRLHNQYRGSVVPEASNMEYMKWDISLAQMAMRYSARCHWGHGHVINVSPHSSVGQNLWIQGRASRNNAPSPASAISAWFNEIRHYKFTPHECTSPYQCGHYTQLVWADTTAVGCAMSFCARTSGNWTHSDSWILTCYYGPAGNYIGVRPYESGPSCTQCKSEVGQCYNNMCRLCNEHNEPCECRQQCVNCGEVDPFSCTCMCKDGWYGPDCGKFCNETHPNCNANPGWPGPQFCHQHPMIPKHCPKMCGLCVDPNPTFVCKPASALPTKIAPSGPGIGGTGGAGTTQAPNPPPNPPAATLPPGHIPPVGTVRPIIPTRGLIPVNPPVNPPLVPVNPPLVPVNPPLIPWNPAPPIVPTLPPFIPTQPRYPYPGPTAVDCKIPCQNGGAQDLACRCTCPASFTGQYCQHDVVQIANGAMLRLVGDVRNWHMMEYDMHSAIEQSVDVFCNTHVAQCCPGTLTPAPTVQKNYLDTMDVLTGTGFPEVDPFNKASYWILLAATKPSAPQLCIDSGNGGAAVEPALLLGRKRNRRDSNSGSEEDGDGGAPAPQYIEQAIMLGSMDGNMAAIQQVLLMYDVKLAEVQRPRHQHAAAMSFKASYMVVGSLVMLLITGLFV